MTAWLILLWGIVFERCAIAADDAIPPQESVDISISLGLFTRHVDPGDDTNEDSISSVSLTTNTPYPDSKTVTTMKPGSEELIIAQQN